MTEKRQWKVVTEKDEVETITSSSVSDGEKAKEEQTAWETDCSHRAEWEQAINQDEDGRPSGARGSEDPGQRPITPTRTSATAAKSRAQGYMADAKDPNIPKKVKERKLADFRKSLYDEQGDGRRLILPTCAPVPCAAQTRCNPPFDQLRWSANADGHYARCKKCDLKHVIYYHERHGVMMTKKGQEAFIAGNPGEAIADSGCRCAVAGGAWHEKFQAELRRLGMTWFEEEEDETFRFGSGPPEKSTNKGLYLSGWDPWHEPCGEDF